MEEIENDKTIPKVDLVDKGNTKVNTEENTVNPLSKMAETKMNRRDFLRIFSVSVAHWPLEDVHLKIHLELNQKKTILKIIYRN